MSDKCENCKHSRRHHYTVNDPKTGRTTTICSPKIFGIKVFCSCREYIPPYDYQDDSDAASDIGDY